MKWPKKFVPTSLSVYSQEANEEQEWASLLWNVDNAQESKKEAVKKPADQLQCCVSHEKIWHHVMVQLCKDMAMLNS